MCGEERGREGAAASDGGRRQQDAGAGGAANAAGQRRAACLRPRVRGAPQLLPLCAPPLPPTPTTLKAPSLNPTSPYPTPPRPCPPAQFTQHLFTLEQEEYMAEGIDWTKVRTAHPQHLTHAAQLQHPLAGHCRHTAAGCLAAPRAAGRTGTLFSATLAQRPASSHPIPSPP